MKTKIVYFRYLIINGTKVTIPLIIFISGYLIEKDRELADIKSKIAEAMALHMIPTSSACMNGTDTIMTSPLYSSKQQKDDGIVKSNLNPHASDYTPKTTT